MALFQGRSSSASSFHTSLLSEELKDLKITRSEREQAGDESAIKKKKKKKKGLVLAWEFSQREMEHSSVAKGATSPGIAFPTPQELPIIREQLFGHCRLISQKNIPARVSENRTVSFERHYQPLLSTTMYIHLLTYLPSMHSRLLGNGAKTGRVNIPRYCLSSHSSSYLFTLQLC